LEKPDILYKSEYGVFSYRVAGIIIHEQKVLLQRQLDDESGYALPGGHPQFGETSQDALRREILEEMGVEIEVQRLLWVGENFFPWGRKDCHQVCLYFLAGLAGQPCIPQEETFLASDQLEGQRIPLEFSWHAIHSLKGILIYPLGVNEKIMNLTEHVEHFIYFEQGTP
jgi:ADP-ribose pyrophosphatase YjhB (NUDIX family)